MANPKASLSALQVYIIAGCSANLSTPPNDSACENNRVDVKKPSATLKHPRILSEIIPLYGKPEDGGTSTPPPSNYCWTNRRARDLDWSILRLETSVLPGNPGYITSSTPGLSSRTLATASALRP